MSTIVHHGIASGMFSMGGTDWIKRQLLFYDKVGITFLEGCKHQLWGYSPVKAQRADTYAYLQERGVVYEAVIPDKSSNTDVDDFLKLASSASDRFDYEHPSDPVLYRERELSGRKPAENSFTHHIDMHAFLCRAVAVDTSGLDGVIATPLLAASSLSTSSPLTKQSVVIQAILKEFPIPEDAVSFDDILQIRNDSEFMVRRNALRSWARNISTKNFSVNETREEIQYLLHQYREYMRVQRIKYSLTSISAIAKFSSGITEDLIKLKFKNVTEAVCSLFTANVNLMDAELKAPGRELAYIDGLRTRL